MIINKEQGGDRPSHYRIPDFKADVTMGWALVSLMMLTVWFRLTSLSDSLTIFWIERIGIRALDCCLPDVDGTKCSATMAHGSATFCCASAIVVVICVTVSDLDDFVVGSMNKMFPCRLAAL